MAVTEAPWPVLARHPISLGTLQRVGKREKRGPEHGLNFREMAMKERLILGAIVLLLATWFALDAVAEIILL